MWKRNLYIIWGAELVAIAGFSVVSPFLPFFIQELGITGEGEVELWSGLLFSGQAVAMTVVAPIWGSLADRYGRKLMVERAMFGGAVIIGLMALVQNVWQLALLRIMQGFLTGTVAAATTLVAAAAPRDRSGYALGMLQTAVWVGASVGPLIGGFVADAWGYRATFVVTGALLFIAGLTVWRGVEEHFQPVQRAEGAVREGVWHGLVLVLRDRGLVSIFSIRVISNLASRFILPTLPLFIQSLLPPTARVASITGLVNGVTAATSAAGALTIGRASDRIGYRRVLVVCSVLAGLVYVPQFFVQSAWSLLFWQASLGLVMSGVLAALSALLANLAPEGRQGAVYGVDTSAVSLANTIGPMAGASIAAAFGLRLPFLLAAAVFGLSAVLAWFLVPPKAGAASNR
jgi:MFS transporter, DHA1 family, multidrug resistance protein